MVILYQLPSNSGPQCQSGPRATYLQQCAYLHSVHVWNPKIFDAPWSFVSMFKTLLYINIYLKSFYSFPSYMFPVLCRSFALFHLSVHLKLGENRNGILCYFRIFLLVLFWMKKSLVLNTTDLFGFPVYCVLHGYFPDTNI